MAAEATLTLRPEGEISHYRIVGRLGPVRFISMELMNGRGPRLLAAKRSTVG